MLIGLTGGLASGKSTAAAYLEALGARVIDADRLGHLAYAPGSTGFDAVVAAFGADLVGEDGHIDRRRLGSLVFAEPAQLSKLNAIVWPEIRRLAQARITEARRQQPDAIICLEAAVLVEAGWGEGFDEVWVVVVAPETAIRRARARDGLSEDQARARLAAQPDNAERARHAKVLLDNSGSIEALQRQIDEQWRRLTESASERAAQQDAAE